MSEKPRISHAGARLGDERGHVRTHLEEAHASAALGEDLRAREMCAHLIRNDMLTIEADPTLLAELADVLLLAGGLEQLARVLRAIGGGCVKVMRSKSMQPGAGHDFVVHAADGRICVTADEAVVGRSGGQAGAHIVPAVTNHHTPSR